MCSKSKVNDALQGVTGSSGSVVPSIAAHQVKANRDAYFLVDVREASEISETPFPDANAAIPMGAICHDPFDLVALAGTDKTIVTVCNTGVRAQIAAEHLPTSSAKVLQRGLVGWGNPAALSPDFVVVLGLGDSPEKLSLALAAAAAAVDMHSTVVVVLMSDGVHWFLKPDSEKAKSVDTPNVETVEFGAPFKPCKAMLQKILSKGGIILACTSCIKHRQYSFETDMMDCVNSLQMPDLVRMLGEAKGGTLQFM
ncbi:expressed unknown protein [Seminavis robusta]|uniref:Rhodanese domain-containing protein n=1 Tax=Seminavis robusta TaxID=568900 RepID=A0A9N8HZP4_9STRA|nr:expressed unknown protein [Seminavis robusta]|eukprot:Sro3033_g342530.1 n/a (254) ;mRNA; f:4496-5257